MASQDNHFVAWNQNSCFSLDWKGKLDKKDSPAVVGDVVLLDRVNATISLVATKDIDIAVFKDHSRHGTTFLI